MRTKLKHSIKLPKLPPHWHPPGGCSCEPGVAYIRVSKVGNRQTIISPGLQLDAIVAYARANNIRLTAIVTDINKSGQTFRKRSVDGIISNIKRGEYRRVVIWKWSRWARNTEESAKYLRLVRDAGGRVDSATEDSDQETALGRLQMDIVMRFDQYQGELIGETWKAVHERREELGLPHGGRDRFGYRYVSEIVVTRGEGEKVDRYIPDDVQAAALAEAYRQYISGVSFRKIAAWLNAGGHRSTLGNLFTPTALVRMMDTGFAAGLIRERSVPTGTPGNSLTCYDVWRQGSHEPIIDSETWRQYKARRQLQAAIPPRLRRAVHELSGMMFCAICKRRMVTKYAGAGRTHQWQCTWQSTYHPGIPVSANNRMVLEVVRDWVKLHAGEEGVNARMSRARKNRNKRPSGPDKAALTAELTRWQRRLNNLIDMRADGEITKEQLQERRREPEHEIERLEDEIASVPEADAGLDVRAFEALDAEWESLNKAGLHDVLAKLAGMVVVSPRTEASTRASLADRVEVIGRWEAERLSAMQRSR